MKQLRLLVFLLALLVTLSACYVGVAAQVTDTKESGATIRFYKPYEPDTGGNNGGDSRDRDRGGGSGFTPGGDDLVTILDPDVPLADLGPLPKTGGYTLIPLMLVAGGLWVAFFALRVQPRGKQQPA